MKQVISFFMILLMANQLSHAQSVTLAPTTVNPTKGTVVFDNATNLLKYWNGTAWIPITNAAAGTGWALSGNDIYNNNTDKVGIHTSIPKASLNIGAGKTVLFGADSSGVGHKLIWYSTKAAFRAGVPGYDIDYSKEYWDYANVGYHSVAMGYGTMASGNASTALGVTTTASGTGSTALGEGSTASNIASTAMGAGTKASGLYATTMGLATIASGTGSTAMGKYNIDIPSAMLMVGNGTGYESRVNAMTVLSDGKVGIGTTTPMAPLHVAGSNVLNSGHVYYFFVDYSSAAVNYQGSGSWATGLLVEKDIIGKQSIVSGLNITTSDARIKNIIGISNNQQDLETLKKLQITDYRYKDIVTWGNQTFKKVIAQQVEEIYPQAVRKKTSTIPDIYSLAEKVVYDEANEKITVTLAKNYDIKAGDKIEVIHPSKGTILAVIASVSGSSFVIKDWKYSTDKLFVFGREVNDFRAVDYEALSMLGISAIQQLAKENEEFKIKNEDLVKEIKSLKAEFSTRLEAIENLLLKTKTVDTHEKNTFAAH